MKAQHRLMKIVQIEKDYQQHRKRLLSIQHINTRKKPNLTTLKPTEATTTYKQSKLKADIFSFKTKNDKIQHSNFILLSKIQQQYGKPGVGSRSRLNLSRSSSAHSVRSMQSSRNIHHENVRIYEKVNNTKSIYSKIRK